MSAALLPQAERPGMRTFVLDTSVLLSDPGALGRFGDHEVVLPLVVISELEGKRHHPELGWFARQTLRVLDDLRIKHGRLDAPVPIGDVGGRLNVELNHSDLSTLPAGFRVDSNDSRILAVALNLANEGRDVTLVTKDMPLRVKAASVGLTADEYRMHPVGDSSPWSGMAELNVSTDSVDALYGGHPLDLVEHEDFAEVADLPCHTGLVLHSAKGSALARITPDKQVKLVRGDREAFGLHGRSAEQRVALDLLLDPDVGIVSLGGRAGTGKSALALCAGLESVLERRAHKRVVVFRAAVRGGRSGARVPAGLGVGEDVALGSGGLRHLGRARLVRRDGRDNGPRHARSAAADSHPRPLPARLVRHRRRGAVAGTQRAADGALPHRRRLSGGAHA